MELMKTVIEINRMIAEAEEELAQLEARRSTILETIKKLSEEKDLVNRSYSLTSKINENAPVTNQSPEADKISLFRKIFKVNLLKLTKSLFSVRSSKEERMYIPGDLRVVKRVKLVINLLAEMNG
jgi:hypothetical protein